MKKMAADGKNVYLVKLGLKSLADGLQDICKDKKNLIWDQRLATKAEVIQSKAVFSFCVRNGRFCNLECLFLFTFEGNIQCAKKCITSPCNALTVINNIVFSSPEAMVEFSGENS